MTALASVVQIILILVTLPAVVILLVFDFCFAHELVKWFRSPEFLTWWRTPPRPISEDRDHLLALVHAAWRGTRSILRF